MISEEKLRKKLQDIWKKKPPITPHSFAEADALIDEIVAVSTVEETKKKQKKTAK